MAEYYDLIRFVFACFTLFVLSGCALTQPIAAKQEKQSNFKEKFFESWSEKPISSHEAEFTALLSFADKSGWYGENLMPIPEPKLQRLLQTALDSKKNVVLKNAVTVRNADIRVLPTEKPFFKEPHLAGEGYPFDYLQNSRIYISTPVKLIYETPHKDYYFVKSPVGYGWVDARSVAFTDDEFERLFRFSTLKTPLADKKPIYGEDGSFVERLNIGTLLPNGYYPAKKEGGKAVWKPYAENKYLGGMFALTNETSVAFAAYSMFGEPYGWGGYLDNRDCSMFLRDIFVAFGLFLPRNSADQAAGYTDISGMGKAVKKEYIKANAKPWRSLVYLKGHIMLYVGVDSRGEPLVMHDVWGIKSFKDGKEGRKMLGGVVVTTMEEGRGEPWYDETKSSLLVKTLGIKDIY